MKKIFILTPLLLITLLINGCQTKTYDIVLTLYPQYDMVRTIVGESDLTYTMILPPGVEAHDYEPTSKQVIQINQSKLFIYTSDELETWAKDIIESDVNVLNLETKVSDLHDHGHEEETHEGEEVHDVHYWVSIDNEVHMVEAILEAIILLDPTNSETYQSNAQSYLDQLMTIEDALLTLSVMNQKTIYFIGHNIFSALNEEFGFNILSLTDSYSPDADPTSAQLSQMMDDIMASGSNYVYYDPFESITLANTIKNDLKTSYNYEVTLLPLHSLHNVSKTQFNDQTSLYELWMENYQNIRLTLEMES